MMKIFLFFLIFSSLIIGNCYADVASYCTNTNYRSYNNISKRLSDLQLASRIPNSMDFYATLTSIGTTTEGRPIQGIIITDPTSTTQIASVLFTGAIHANEWIGTELAIGLAEYLVSNRTNTNSALGTAGSRAMNVKSLLAKVKVIIVPVLNPDGYEYSMYNYDESCVSSFTGTVLTQCYTTKDGVVNVKKNSVWRKNRRTLSSTYPEAIGVDINRNFDAIFSAPTDTSVISMLADTYSGLSAMSENETQAVKLLFDAFTPKIKAEIDFHSGEEKVLYPWGNHADIDSTVDVLRPNSNTKDLYLFNKMGEKIAKHVGFTLVSNETVSTTYYDEHATGLARDWVYAKYKSASFNIELAEKHQPPVNQTSTICTKSVNGPLWLMFWAADTGFRNRPTLHLGQ